VWLYKASAAAIVVVGLTAGACFHILQYERTCYWRIVGNILLPNLELTLSARLGGCDVQPRRILTRSERIESDSPPKQAKCEGSSSFLKKRTKKLLFSSVRTDRISRVSHWIKSFLVLFFKKELLSCCTDVSVSTRVDISFESCRMAILFVPCVCGERLLPAPGG
jgi:hypothetical protein